MVYINPGLGQFMSNAGKYSRHGALDYLGQLFKKMIGLGKMACTIICIKKTH